MANEKEKEVKQAKRSSAKKRQLQDQKKRLRNRAFRSEVRTIIKQFRETVSSGSSEQLKALLARAFSLMDKGVNKSIFKRNKANRIKARLVARLHACTG
jgi:small subunit ribosomal protein S20